ncbi:MAG: 6-carboxytetrahydropterin synthase [Phenylobacterium sp.]|jgi:6-pyruvoyltetrahydropterin/6-carboxytetrahydropterin synthase|uniref:6-pyruvoyl trahydropterin synthase family protein n=1 Tax=Phenylobacterium sp. TaxID=1871053 RepID=UPI002A36086B|nr:6-carboxytetrahydropterin synthase [Phenylobacterium sp.]MDX9998797.1 6-carboxytetrahydropterin synthase [Phenylobacterium sp.]
MAHLSTKTYGAERGLTCALRQWRADSHCALLHGYSLGFRFTFAAEQLDAAGWVVDFGKGGFGPIREWLHATFDHTLLVAEDDPARETLMALGAAGLAQPRLVPGVSCERLAQYVFDNCDPMVRAASRGRCWIDQVECFEHGANSAIYRNPEAVTRQVTAEALQTLVREAL